MNRWCGIAMLLGIVASGTVASVDSAEAARRPNIVLITADNLGYHDTGCYGNKEIRTPNIDRLAEEGVRCTNFYSVSPTCTVSRASLLTGRYPQRHGLTHQLTTSPDLKVDENMGVGLRHSELLIPHFIKQQGYATACFGKWNIGFAKGSRPTERGFDEYLGNASGHIDYYTHVYKGRNDMFRGTQPVPDLEGYSTYLYADDACDFICRNAQRPFFLYLPFNAVHYPSPLNTALGKECIWQAPNEAFELYGYSPYTRDAKKRYQATVTALDMGVGRVLDQIDLLGLKENTLVIFSSDNGAFKAQMGYASNYPYRTERIMLYEGSIRVCGIVRWPGQIGPGTVCDQLLTSMDFFPMILRAAGEGLPDDRIIDGRDPLAALAGKAPSPHDVLFWQYGGSSAVRSGPHKLLRRTRKEPFQLFDSADDPGETKDEATEKPKVVARLKRQFEEWLKTVRKDSPQQVEK